MTTSTTTKPLEDLLARCALGDRIAFADLYDATSAKLFGVLLRMLKQNDQAEDALQDVYLKIWRKAADYHVGKGRVMTWLISIARNHAIDQLRRADARPTLSHEEHEQPDQQAASGAAVFDLAKRLTDNALLAICLDELDPQRRACVVLAYCEGYTHDELSIRLGSPIGTIKSWIRRSLQALKSCLEENHG